MGKDERFLKIQIELGDDRAVEEALASHQGKIFQKLGSKGIGLALAWAARTGRPRWVEILIPASSSGKALAEALVSAAAHGNARCLAMLIPFADAMAMDAEALRSAAAWGGIDCVKLLLPVSLTGEANNFARRAASAARERGHEDVARLIEDFDSAQRDRAALERAAPAIHGLAPSIRKRDAL